MRQFAIFVCIVLLSTQLVAQESVGVWTFTPIKVVIEYDGGYLAVYDIEENNGEYQSELSLGMPDRSTRPSQYQLVGFIERIVFVDEDFVRVITSEGESRGAFYSVTQSRSSAGFAGVPIVVLSFVTDAGNRERIIFHVVDGQLQYSQSSPPILSPMRRYDAFSRMIYFIDTGNTRFVEYQSLRFEH